MALANEQVILARIALTLYISNVGEKLVNFLVEPKKGTKWPSNLPRFENRTQAIAVAKDLCKYGFVHRSEKRGKGQLAVSTVVQYTPVYTYIHRYLSILFKRRLTHFFSSTHNRFLECATLMRRVTLHGCTRVTRHLVI